MTGPDNFDAFMRNYQDMVYSTAVRIVGQKADAEDIAQNVFLKAYERFAELAESPSAGGWLKVVATNLSLKVVRTDGQLIDFGVALVRSLSAFLSAAVLFLGFFWASWTQDRQSWHDKIAGTVVVKLPKGVSALA
jgi:DNA-directed RNA polymerase specialized sigma24 family protein